MATFVIPEDFEGQINLLGKIKQKVDTDGVASPLISFFAEHSIVLSDDIIAGGKAEIQETAHTSNNKLSQNYIQLRNLGFDPVMSHIRGEMQYMKLYVKPNFKALGVWGVTVVAPSRIVYPTNFIAATELFGKIQTQYNTYPIGTSPLDVYLTKKQIVMANDAMAVASAIANNTKAEAATKTSEEGTQNRDIFWKTPLEHLHMICAVLMVLCSGNEKALGEYGIIVTEDKKPDVLRTSTILPMAQITTSGIVIGSSLTNTGTVDINVYKGKTILGAYTTVKPGTTLGMTKGYSVITVTNPSTTVTAKFTVKVVR